MQIFMYDPVFIMNAKTVMTTANVVLLVLLMAIYVQSYTRIKSKFTLGLMIFAFLLLLHAVTSTPCMHGVDITACRSKRDANIIKPSVNFDLICA